MSAEQEFATCRAAHGAAGGGAIDSKPAAASRVYCALSPSAAALDAIAGRLTPARRATLRRIRSDDGQLEADVSGAWTELHGPGGDAVAMWAHGRDGFGFRRDSLGVAPLYFTRCRDAGAEALVVAGAALEAQHASGRPGALDPGALHRYLATGAVAGTAQTLLAGIQCLPRDRQLEVHGASLALAERELAAPAPDEFSRLGRAGRIEALRELLLAAVRPHTAATAGVALSGGIDSSGLLGALAQVRGADGAPPAFTHSMAAEDAPSGWDEAAWARQAALHVGARHHVQRFDPADLPAATREALARHDFPFSSPVVLAQAGLFRSAAAQGVTTLLGGHGPDLLFGGADTHLVLRLAQLLRAGRLPAAARFLSGAGRHASAAPHRLLLSALKLGLTGRIRLEPESAAADWVAPAWREAHRDAIRPARTLRAWQADAPLHALIEQQLTCSLGASSLLWELRNAEAAGIAIHQPYLTLPFWRLSRACAEDELVSPQGRTKAILREALAGLVPAPILQRERRVGFAIPLCAWLLRNRPWVEQCVAELRGLPAFAGPDAATLWRLLESDTRPGWLAAFRLWRWIALLEWSRLHDLRCD